MRPNFLLRGYTNVYLWKHCHRVIYGDGICCNIVLWLLPKQLPCRSNSHFNVCRLNIWYHLYILHQRCNPLWICYCLHLHFMCHISIWFNMNLLHYVLLTLCCDALIRCSLLSPFHSHSIYLIISAFFAMICFLRYNSSELTISNNIWSLWYALILSNKIN